MKYKDTDYDIYEDGSCYSHLSNKFLKPQIKNKYPTYNLTINGKKKKIYIHRMVAETFIPNNDILKNIVNHKDGNTQNFCVENLEWVTPVENSLHSCANGLTPKGDQTINRFVDNLPNEIWCEIKDFPNYLISSCGRIMNHKTKRLLKPALSNHGYLEVNLWCKNKGYTKQIHLLVYQNIKKDYNTKNFVINHINGNKIDNNIDNLEKVTYQENNLHAVYQINTNNCNKPVYQLDGDNNIINAFQSIALAQRTTKINNISRAIKTGRKAGGFYWRFQ